MPWRVHQRKRGLRKRGILGRLIGNARTGHWRFADFAKRMECEVKVIVYLRDQADMAVAFFFQHAKRDPNFDPRAMKLEDFLRTYSEKACTHYDRHLDLMESIFGSSAMAVRPFNRSMFPNGDVVLDFLEVIGVPGEQRGAFRTEFKDVNITPRQRDLFFRMQLSGLQPGLPYSDALLAGVSSLYASDTRDHSGNLLVDPAWIEELRMKYAEGNVAMTKKWFDGIAPSQLLEPKSYKPLQEMEITREDLFFWLLWTNAALIKSMKVQHEQQLELRDLRRICAGESARSGS